LERPSISFEEMGVPEKTKVCFLPLIWCCLFLLTFRLQAKASLFTQTCFGGKSAVEREVWYFAGNSIYFCNRATWSLRQYAAFCSAYKSSALCV